MRSPGRLGALPAILRQPVRPKHRGGTRSQSSPEPSRDREDKAVKVFVLFPRGQLLHMLKRKII